MLAVPVPRDATVLSVLNDFQAKPDVTTATVIGLHGTEFRTVEGHRFKSASWPPLCKFLGAACSWRGAMSAVLRNSFLTYVGTVAASTVFIIACPRIMIVPILSRPEHLGLT